LAIIEVTIPPGSTNIRKTKTNISILPQKNKNVFFSLGMNPMELYVGQPEGVAFYSAAAQGKFFACYTLVGGNFRYIETRFPSRPRCVCKFKPTKIIFFLLSFVAYNFLKVHLHNS
jgi:hypothetical protein